MNPLQPESFCRIPASGDGRPQSRAGSDHRSRRNQLGAVNRALRMQVDVGGKAVNVASCLSDFNIRTAVTGQIGRDNAALFEELFQRKKIANHCCYLDGLTRINSKLVDTVSGDTTDLNMPGPEFDLGHR
jgi:1-phosphofructokinase